MKLRRNYWLKRANAWTWTQRVKLPPELVEDPGATASRFTCLAVPKHESTEPPFPQHSLQGGGRHAVRTQIRGRHRARAKRLPAVVSPWDSKYNLLWAFLPFHSLICSATHASNECHTPGLSQMPCRLYHIWCLNKLMKKLMLLYFSLKIKKQGS